jgi:hypothetical protein
MQFVLVPFKQNNIVDRLEGEFDVSADKVTCTWRLFGDLDRIRWPETCPTPRRRMSLWEHTCFEFFIGASDNDGYYEYNQSPAGHWNSFSFSGVRTDMAETDVLRSIACATARLDERTASITAEVRFRPPGAGPYRVGVSAVIEAVSGRYHYFALAHGGGRPDFHHRDNHSLVVP